MAASRLRPILYMIVATLMFAGMDALNKDLSQHFPVAQIMTVRFAIFIAMACALAKDGPWLIFRSRAPWWQMLRTAVLLGEMLAFVLSFRYLPLADVHALAAASPLLATALAFFFLREKVDAVGWLLVLGGLVGAALVVGPAFETFGPAMWIAVAAATLWAVYQIVTRVLGGLDSTDVTTMHTPLVGFFVLGFFAWRDWVPPDPMAWLLLVAGGTIGAAAHTLIVRALALAPASVLQPYSYFMLVFATSLGVIFYGDIPGLWTWIGATIVVACGLVAIRRQATAAS